MFKQTLLAGAALAVAQAASAAVIIDNFNLPGTGAQNVCDTRLTPGECNATPQASQYFDSTLSNQIFGNYRELYINAPNIGDNSDERYTARVGNGRLSIATPAPADVPNPGVWTSIVRWDGASVGTFTSDFGGGFLDTYGINQTGVAATDLTAGGSNVGFAATITGSDGPFSFELQVFSAGGNWTSLILGAREVGNCGSVAPPDCFPAPFTLNIGFNQFQTLSGFAVQGGQIFGTGANFNAITAAQIIFRGTESVDFTLDMIQAVPEPTSLALVGLGLLGAGLARRRMMKA